ncbi:MAG: hypothetical protein JNM94_15295 [Phycisphaerae bacterium]|nr:hypothetical protein [Phycisphaerae bacterium]
MAVVFREKRLAFVHVPRTGGTSIAEGISRQLGALRFAPHLRACDLIDAIGREEWFALHSIAVVRHPIDWLRSTWRFARGEPLQPLFLHAHMMPFATFADRAGDVAPVGWRPLDYLLDENGELAVRHVLRFERLDEEWRALVEALGLEALGFSPELPHVNASRRAEIGHDDSDECELGLAAYGPFAREFAALGYEMPPSIARELEANRRALAELLTPGWLACNERRLAVARCADARGERGIARRLLLPLARAGSDAAEDLLHSIPRRLVSQRLDDAAIARHLECVAQLTAHARSLQSPE